VFPSLTRNNSAVSHEYIIREIKRIGYAKRMTGHGCRSLAMGVIKEKLDYRHEVVDRQLAHVPKGVDKAYDRSTFMTQRVQMMQQYADYIDLINQPPQPERKPSHEQQYNYNPYQPTGYSIYRTAGSFTYAGQYQRVNFL
jgi:hypothetical protein